MVAATQTHRVYCLGRGNRPVLHIPFPRARNRVPCMYAPIRLGCIRTSGFAAALLAVAAFAGPEAQIRSLTGIIDGHAVGGVTADMIGTLYVADFGETVWKVTPEGERTVFASGLYGASGNAIDNE